MQLSDFQTSRDVIFFLKNEKRYSYKSISDNIDGLSHATIRQISSGKMVGSKYFAALQQFIIQKGFINDDENSYLKKILKEKEDKEELLLENKSLKEKNDKLIQLIVEKIEKDKLNKEQTEILDELKELGYDIRSLL